MNIQDEVREALSGFIKKFGLSCFGDFNVADLTDILVRLNDVEKAILHRIEVALDEKGEHTTPVFVKPGFTIEEEPKPVPGKCKACGTAPSQVKDGPFTVWEQVCPKCHLPFPTRKS